MVSLDEMKQYLRVDTSDDDMLIGSLIESSIEMCADVARMDVQSYISSADRTSRIAVLYATANAYENRDDFDPHTLKLQLRAILAGKREVAF